MGYIPPARKLYTGPPVIAIWNGSTLLWTLKFSELDNSQPDGEPIYYDFSVVKVNQVPTITDTDGMETEYILGYRIGGVINYGVWPDGYLYFDRSTVARQMTEYELTLLRIAEKNGYHIQLYPHDSQYLGASDTTRDIIITKSEVHRVRTQDRLAATLEWRYRNLIKTDANIWAYTDSL